MFSNDDEEEDFPPAELNDQVWSEEPIPNRWWLYIYLILCHSITGHTPRPATPPLQPVQEEVLPEAELMSQYWMTYQTSSIFPRKDFTQILTLGHRVYSDINGEMTFEFGQ